MFNEQIRLHNTLSGKAFPHEKRALSDNFDILQKRLKMLHDNQEELAKDLRRVNEYNRELDLEMNSLKPEIIQLYKQREQHQSWLLSHGARVEEVHKLLVQSSREMPHNDETSWLMPDVDRVKVSLTFLGNIFSKHILLSGRGNASEQGSWNIPDPMVR